MEAGTGSTHGCQRLRNTLLQGQRAPDPGLPQDPPWTQAFSRTRLGPRAYLGPRLSPGPALDPGPTLDPGLPQDPPENPGSTSGPTFDPGPRTQAFPRTHLHRELWVRARHVHLLAPAQGLHGLPVC